MRQTKYNIPIYEDEDLADLQDYSEKMAEAIKTQIDKFGNPLNFKGSVLTLSDLQLITDNENGDIYTVKEENKNYIWNGTQWVEYSNNTPVTTDELVKEVIEIIQKGHIYGVKRNIESSDPAWERIGDSVGLVANATHDGTEVQNDFDNIYPYSDIISYNYDVGSQRITAYYGEPTFKFDGTNGEVMTRIPEFWYKREQNVEEDGNTYEYVYIADYEAEGFIKSEAFSLSRYTASGNSERLHSTSGKEPLVNNTSVQLRTYVKTLGSVWGNLDIKHWSLLQVLYLVEYANYNSQEKIGQGRTLAMNTVANNSGGCDELGMKSGTLENDGTHSVIYRGIEDIFGNVQQFCDGVTTASNGQAYICYNSEKYDNTPNDNYNELGYTYPIFTSKSYIKKIGYDENNPLIQFPIESDGSNNTYITDQYKCSERIGCACWVGGMYKYEAGCGLWGYFFDVYTNSSNIAGYACRLLLNK